MRVLVVSPYLPHSRIGHGGGISIYNFLRYLAREHEVTCLCFERQGESDTTGELESHGVRVETVPFRSEKDSGLSRVALWADRTLALVRARLSRNPFFVQKYLRSEMFDRLGQLIDSWQPDAVQVEYMFMAHYARHARACGVTAPKRPLVLLSTHEAGTVPRLRRLLQDGSQRERSRQAHDLKEWIAYEKRAVTYADVNLCVSDPDRRILQSYTDRTGFVTLPLGIDTDHLPRANPKFATPPRMLFVGSFAHPPNRDAAEILVQRILPRIQNELPQVCLDIVGKNPPARLQELARAAGPAVRLHGFVESLDSHFDDTWLFVAPLFSGGGIKIKILEALGRQVPVLTTPIGLEGIELTADTEVIVAHEPDHFAAQAVLWLQNPDGLREVARRGAETARARYGWDAVVQRLERIVAHPPSPPSA